MTTAVGIDAPHQVGPAGGGVVVGRVVQRLDGHPQRRIGVETREYSFFIDDFAKIEPEPTD